MLLIDKYKCKNDYDLLYNEDIMRQLKNISKYKNIPNIILYGNIGSGKKTLVNLFLKYVYNDDIFNLNYRIIDNGQNKKEINYKYSPYHMILNFVKNFGYDKCVIQELIKTYAASILPPDNRTNKTFKTVFIQNIENLSYYAQMSLRRTMERYSNQCKFIFTTDAINNIIEPLKSRCICIRVPNPSNHNLKLVLNNIYFNETKNINTHLIDYITSHSNHNIKNSILLLNLYLNITSSLGYNNFINSNINFHDVIFKYTFDSFINEVVDNILKKNLYWSYNNVSKIYNIIISNINPNNIFNSILIKLINNPNLNISQKNEIINITRRYNIRSANCRRIIFELVNYINSIIIFLLNF